MRILGIHGWNERSHDAAACLVEDGRMVAMAEEERFVRERYAYNRLPLNASAYCLDQAGIKLDEIDFVAWGWDYPDHYNIRNLKWQYLESDLAQILFPQKMFHWTRVPKIIPVPHHRAHAASVFRTSPFNEAGILVIDGQGERAATTLAYGKENQIEIIRSFPIDFSLGYFYEAVSQHIGFRSHDGGKTMGLAAFGQPVYVLDEFHVTDDGYEIQLPRKMNIGENGKIDEQKQVISLWEDIFHRKLSISNRPNYYFRKSTGRFSTELHLSEKEKNLAASAQVALENVIFHLINVLRKETGCTAICIAGGVGLNCSVNGKLRTLKIVEDLFVQPAANDAGCAMGSAFELYASLGYHSRFPLTHSYWGPEYSTAELAEILDNLQINHEYFEDISEAVAQLLADGKIVGWFQGRMEIGPRALGNRSILADPRKNSIADRVNLIKGREKWRPLAPSLPNENRSSYLGGNYPSPFMLISNQVLDTKQSEIAGVVHVDGSTRPQTIEEIHNPRYWQLIKRFEKITGTPVILNTSFNAAGEPIVCTPFDALRTFFSTGIDCLAMGDFLIRKQ